MKNRKIIDIKKVIISFIAILLILSSSMYIYSLATNSPTDISRFNGTDTNTKAAEVTRNAGGVIISIIRIVSVTIALVMLLVIAMKYMVSAPGDRADIKKHAIAYVVGAIILFGVTGILSILVNFASKITISE